MEWTNFDVAPVIQGGAEDESGITDIVVEGACPDPGGGYSALSAYGLQLCRSMLTDSI